MEGLKEEDNSRGSMAFWEMDVSFRCFFFFIQRDTVKSQTQKDGKGEVCNSTIPTAIDAGLHELDSRHFSFLRFSGRCQGWMGGGDSVLGCLPTCSSIVHFRLYRTVPVFSGVENGWMDEWMGEACCLSSYVGS